MEIQLKQLNQIQNRLSKNRIIRENNILALGGEIWKPIKGFPKYVISSHGKIKNILADERMRIENDLLSGPEYVTGGIKKEGYHFVIIQGVFPITKNKLVHRLVAETFIPNPCNKPCVTHINNDRLNNNVTKLQWSTLYENNINKNNLNDLKNKI